MPVLVAGDNVLIKFDVVDRYLPLLLGKNIKEWHLIINIGKDTAQLTVNNVIREL